MTARKNAAPPDLTLYLVGGGELRPPPSVISRIAKVGEIKFGLGDPKVTFEPLAGRRYRFEVTCPGRTEIHVEIREFATPRQARAYQTVLKSAEQFCRPFRYRRTIRAATNQRSLSEGVDCSLIIPHRFSTKVQARPPSLHYRGMQNAAKYGDTRLLTADGVCDFLLSMRSSKPGMASPHRGTNIPQTSEVREAASEEIQRKQRELQRFFHPEFRSQLQEQHLQSEITAAVVRKSLQASRDLASRGMRSVAGHVDTSEGDTFFATVNMPHRGMRLIWHGPIRTPLFPYEGQGGVYFQPRDLLLDIHGDLFLILDRIRSSFQDRNRERLGPFPVSKFDDICREADRLHSVAFDKELLLAWHPTQHGAVPLLLQTFDADLLLNCLSDGTRTKLTSEAYWWGEHVETILRLLFSRGGFRLLQERILRMGRANIDERLIKDFAFGSGSQQKFVRFIDDGHAHHLEAAIRSYKSIQQARVHRFALENAHRFIEGGLSPLAIVAEHYVQMAYFVHYQYRDLVRQEKRVATVNGADSLGGASSPINLGYQDHPAFASINKFESLLKQQLTATRREQIRQLVPDLQSIDPAPNRQLSKLCELFASLDELSHPRARTGEEERRYRRINKQIIRLRPGLLRICQRLRKALEEGSGWKEEIQAMFGRLSNPS